MNITVQAYCEQTIVEADNVRVFTFRMQAVDNEFFRALHPGRHVAICYPDAENVSQKRFYSIIRRQAPDLFEIAVKRSGRSGISDSLHSTCREGSVVSIHDVAGDISIESIVDNQSIGMIAGGIGITLPIALLRELAVRSRNGCHVPNVVLLLCVQKISDIPFLHELLALNLTTTWFNFQIFITREDIQNSDHFLSGRPSKNSLNILEQPQTAVICGSHSFAQTFRQQVAQKFPGIRILAESFTSPTVSVLSEGTQEGGDPPLQLRIVGSNDEIAVYAGKSLLDMLESEGVPIRSQCRAGICGTCRVKVVGGECKFESDFCLSDQDKRGGYALACCTFPLSGYVTVDLRLNA